MKKLLLALVLSSATLGVLGQTYPSKPIRLVVNSGPGAGADQTARALAEQLGRRLGTTVVVENSAGAGGLIGAQAVKRAARDGYTLLFSSDSPVLLTALGANKDLDVVRDFQPVVLVATLNFFLVLSGEALASRTAGDFIRLARDRRGALSYASPGVGSPHHFGMELLKQQTGIDIVHVPYRGTGATMSDLVEGRVQAVMTGLPAVASHMKTGKLRIVAVASPVRSPQLPDVPTLAESGVQNVEIQGYFFLAAPLGVPAAIVERLNREANEVLKAPDVREEFQRRGTNAEGGSTGQLGAKLRAELEKWTAVASKAGIKPE
jgi:tripartite-type tricarboxylate transporter receptor subunit TctC